MLGGWDFFFPAFESGTYTQFRGEKKMNNTCTLEECGWSDMVEELGVDGVSLSLSLLGRVHCERETRKKADFILLFVYKNQQLICGEERAPTATSISAHHLAQLPKFFFPLFPCSRTYAMCRSPPNSLMLNCLLDIIERGCAVSRC